MDMLKSNPKYIFIELGKLPHDATKGLIVFAHAVRVAEVENASPGGSFESALIFLWALARRSEVCLPENSSCPNASLLGSYMACITPW